MKPLMFISLIFLLSTMEAYYPGETYSFNNSLQNENLIWTIVDNSTSLDVLPEVSYNETNITVYFPQNMPPNSFTIVFLEEQTKEVIKEIHVGGGGGGTNTIIKNQTQIVEQPYFVDREVEKIVYINQTEENNSTIPKEDLSKGKTIFWIIGVFLGTIIVVLIILILKKIFKENKVYDWESKYNWEEGE